VSKNKENSNIFPNPNYRPDQWREIIDEKIVTNNLDTQSKVDTIDRIKETGIPVIDKSNALMNKINNLINEAKHTAEQKSQEAEELRKKAEQQKQLAEEMKKKAEEQEQLAQELNKRITTDELTGCFNLIHYEVLKNHWDRQRNNDNKFGLIFIDINDLKVVNDNFGHSAGDKLITETVNYLKTKFREADSIIRIGGDELIIFCKNENNNNDFKKNLEEKMADIWQKASPIQIVFADGLTNEIDMSFAYGVAVFDTKEGDKEVEDVQKRADKLMYKKKKEMKKEKAKAHQIPTNQTIANQTEVEI